jgi:hypothetical protein
MATHTDHPMRHWDRTCPACQEKDKKISQLTAMTKEPTKLMAIPEIMEAAGWVRKKEWVGLTDEERHEIREWQRIQEELGPVWSPMMMYLYLAIEAKLKEKNL